MHKCPLYFKNKLQLFIIAQYVLSSLFCLFYPLFHFVMPYFKLINEISISWVLDLVFFLSRVTRKVEQLFLIPFRPFNVLRKKTASSMCKGTIQTHDLANRKGTKGKPLQPALHASTLRGTNYASLQICARTLISFRTNAVDPGMTRLPKIAGYS